MTRAAPTTLRPTSAKEVRDAVLDTPGRLAITGAGTATGWAGRAGDDIAATLDLSALSGVIHHNPGDMTVSVHAGTPVRALQEQLAEHGQRLAFDAARVARGATVGGLLATADAGPSALVWGGLRDLVIGTTSVLADGTMVRSGGHVIKNVAGYDMAKLMHGSYGTFGPLVEVVLRLHPVPKAVACVGVDGPVAEAASRVLELMASPLEPIAVEWVSGDPGRLLVRLEGGAQTLPARVERLRELLGADAREVGADAWDAHTSLTDGPHAGGDGDGPALDGAVVRIGCAPTRLAPLVEQLPATAVTAGLATGVATVTVPGAAVAEVHDAVAAVGGTSVLRDRPETLDAPAWGPAPSALALLRAVKTQLDPEARFAAGRFAPWM
ncbi:MULTISPECIES: FAD-binding oxidoreductase [Pseudonocardia]|jgi:glycolate oxidase FAD binding subunit|uniref:FAD-binding oxidoreductase n=1 Tax=Pseudonocardia TaxID=1847 RepID=UPI0020985FF3|nr:FAD-binding protein [Pseudonocardia sp. McavD-2-B]MCO7193401.1 FAD-binding protein [Pseudonocardia sp. McavD-2-B]